MNKHDDDYEVHVADSIMQALDSVYADPTIGQELEFETDMGTLKVFVVMEIEAPPGTVIQ